MPTRWYLARGGKATGPFTAEELRDLAGSGRLARRDMVLQEGTKVWAEAGTVAAAWTAPAAPVATPQVLASTVPAVPAGGRSMAGRLGDALGGILLGGVQCVRALGRVIFLAAQLLRARRRVRRSEQVAYLKNIAFGRKVFQSGLGSKSLLVHIDNLTASLAEFDKNATPSAGARKEEEALYAALALQFLGDDSIPAAAADEQSEARRARQVLAEQRTRHAELRTALKQRGGFSSTQVAIGLALVVALLAVPLVWLWPRDVAREEIHVAAATPRTPVPPEKSKDPETPQTKKNPAPAGPKTIKQLFAELAPSVPLLLAHDDLGLRSTGSGFLIARGDKLLVGTNRHVIERASQGVAVHFSNKANGEKLEIAKGDAKVTSIHKDVDLALLDVTAHRARIQALGAVPLTMAPADFVPSEGEKIFVIGHPGASGKAGSVLSHSVSDGIVSGVGRRDDFLKGSFVQVTAAINPGNSGGPIFDADGRIIAVATFVIRWTPDRKTPLEGLNFGLEMPFCHRLTANVSESLSSQEIASVLKPVVLPQNSQAKLYALAERIMDSWRIKQGLNPFTGAKKTSLVPCKLAGNGGRFNYSIRTGFASSKISIGFVNVGSRDVTLSVTSDLGKLMVSHPGHVDDPMVQFVASAGVYNIQVTNFDLLNADGVLLLMHDK